MMRSLAIGGAVVAVLGLRLFVKEGLDAVPFVMAGLLAVLVVSVLLTQVRRRLLAAGLMSSMMVWEVWQTLTSAEGPRVWHFMTIVIPILAVSLFLLWDSLVSWLGERA